MIKRRNWLKSKIDKKLHFKEEPHFGPVVIYIIDTQEQTDIMCPICQNNAYNNKNNDG